jgi:hypothetical protein
MESFMTARKFNVRLNDAYRAPGALFTSTRFDICNPPPNTVIDAVSLDDLIAQINRMGEERGQGCSASVTPCDRTLRKWPNYDKRTRGLTYHLDVKPANWIDC